MRRPGNYDSSEDEEFQKNWEEAQKKYGHDYQPPRIEARAFSSDGPAMRPNQTILICMRDESVEPDDEIRRLMQLASNGEDPSELLEQFAARCDTGLMVCRDDATVTIRLVSGRLKTHKVEDILAAVTRPKPEDEK